MSGYAFHKEAFTDIDQLWEYLAEHNIDAADRVIADISSRTHRTRARFGLWRFSTGAVILA